MNREKKVLVIGTNYGLLLAGLLVERGFNVSVFGKEKEVKILNKEGFIFNMNNKYWKFPTSRKLNFIHNFNENNFDLAILAVQEPTLSTPSIAEIIHFISKKSIPTLSIMNIPIFNFLKDNIGLQNIDNLDTIYSSLNCLNFLNSKLIINSNPEPQIFSTNKFNNLSIRLGGVFRCSNLNILDKNIVLDLTKSINDGMPVKIKSYTSPWVSLSKLPMLITGNYRCLNNFKLKSIHDAVKEDVNQSEKIYNQVVEVMKILGAGRETIIPFKSYLKASIKLDVPSSVCRLIVNGNKNVERVDKLVESIAKSVGYYSADITKIVKNINESLIFFQKNKK